MATANNNGEVTWSDTVLFDPNKGNVKKDEWLRLKEGSNVVRILTLPHQYAQHTYNIEGGRKYGYRVNCSKTKETGCPLCEQGDNAKRRWLLGVIDRETNMYKILDVSAAIFKGVKTLNDDADWGDPIAYDVSIINTPAAGAQRYSVIGKPKKPLSASDVAIQAENGTEVLLRRTAAPTYEQVQARLAKIAEEVGGNTGGSSNSSNNSDDSEEDESQDNFFRDYDSKKKSA